MKRSIYILTLIGFILIGLGSCSNDTEIDTSTLEGKREALTKNKDKVAELKAEIEKLEAEIAELDPSSVKKEKALNITTTKVEKKDFEEFIEIVGNIETKGNYTATSEIPGTITSMNYKEGDAIGRGSLVATIDNESTLKSKGELELKLKLARDVFERRERLWKQNIGSEIEFLTAKNNVESLEKSIETLGTQISKANVYAPAGGVVERVNLRQGELASPGVPIINIISTANVQVVADVAETYLPVIKKGSKINVHIPSLNMDREAKITKIGTLINPNNRTFKIEANISNKDRVLKPNLQTMIKISQFKAEDAIVVPTNIVRRNAGEEFVFVIEQTPSGKRAKKQIIKTGKSFEGQTLIEAGLTGDEELVAEGGNLVKDGSLLRIR